MSTLRNFLFLDRQVLEDFIAEIEGNIVTDETIEEVREEARDVHGEAGISVVKGGGASRSTNRTSTTRQTVRTDPAQFQRLYAHLQAQGHVRYYHVVDETIWDGVQKHDILELEVDVNFTKIGSMANTVGELANAANMFESITGSTGLDETAKEALTGFGLLGQLEAQKGTPVIMNILGSPRYRVFGFLPADAIRVPRDRLTGEATILCKVQRKLLPGEKVELFQPFSGLKQLPLNRQQRRNMPKLDMPKEFQDTISSPAALVIPIAIYR